MNCELLICPVCGGALSEAGQALRCEKGHSFDLAKETYVNLLTGSKPADAMGDNKQAARFRRDFLNQDYYALLRDGLAARFAGRTGTLLDLCCGEGYYTAALGALPGLQVYGFDLAREMVRLAAKRHAGLTLFVANLARIPVRDGSFDWATLLFAPFQEKELLRILKPGGKLTVAVPGRRHLYGLKQAVYDRPYENDEALPVPERLRLCDTRKLTGRIVLRSQADIQALFRMTPYYYRSAPGDRDKLVQYDTLETEIEFILAEYQKEDLL
ncbi:MAG: methyltransferase domain-containing protein [Oscillospiraceae bacterium]|nr:methyltransferase domain-containing protein [Oscillospiraceae bacterium]